MSTSPSSPTRRAIIAAMAEIAPASRYHAIRVTDLIARSGVGRSTFYEHFSGKDDVLVALADPLLDRMASAAAGRLSRAGALEMIDHCWAMRGVLRTMLADRPRARLQSALAGRIVHKHALVGTAPGSMDLLAQAAAAGQLALIAAWITGRTGHDRKAVADMVLAFSAIKPAPCPA